jgi:hypothetical protein
VDDVYDPLEDRLLDDDPSPALLAMTCSDQIKILVVPLDVDPGLYTLFAVVDYEDVIPELSEGNNARGISFAVEGAVAPPIDLTLNPIDPPIIIPAEGGAFRFSVLVTNISENPETFDVWAEVVLPDGSVYLFGPVTLTLGPGQTRGPVTLRQQVPGRVPSGLYIFRVKAGTFPDEEIDAESFEVEKRPPVAGRAASGSDAWATTQLAGPPLAGLETAPAALAAVFVAPNPAREAASVTFDLAAPGGVTLRVYDVLGRVVLTRPAQVLDDGRHTLVLDLGALPAGAYLYRLETDAGATEAGRFSIAR